MEKAFSIGCVIRAFSFSARESDQPSEFSAGYQASPRRCRCSRATGFFCALVMAFFLICAAAPARAADPSEYRTPLAGEQCDIECLGRKYALPKRDRENTRALVFGGSLFAPDLAGHSFIPIGALYYKHRFHDLRVRGVFSILVNEVDLSRTSGQFQLLGHVDNNTIPFAATEIDAGKDVPGTSIKWGTANLRLGAGWRLPVAPFQIDNDLRLQLYYQAGYLYSKRLTGTGQGVLLPPDTPVHGPLFRIRYDGLRRNLMELPHEGMAAGLDAEYLTRGTWSDANYGAATFPEAATRDYLKLSGYLNVATGIPLLSEKHRLITSFYGGFAPYGTLDRFSTFRIGGGPIPSEADDMERQVFPGAMFSQFPVADYLIGALEYRREIFSFLYFHLRGTYARVTREVFSAQTPGNFLTETGEALTAGLTSGFFWHSEMHLEYTYDSTLLRSGTRGSNVILLWSKSF